MDDFSNFVEYVKNEQNYTNSLPTIYGKTRNGQKFGILVRSLEYQCLAHIIMDEEHITMWQKNGQNFWQNSSFSLEKWIFTAELKKETMEELKKTVNQIKQYLEDGCYDDFRKAVKNGFYDTFKQIVKFKKDSDYIDILLPNECIQNPDNYLKHGAIIQSDLIHSPNNKGIYVGNRKVLHVSNKINLKGSQYVTNTKAFAKKNCATSNFLKLRIFRIRNCSYFETTYNANKLVKSTKNLENSESKKECDRFTFLCNEGFEPPQDENIKKATPFSGWFPKTIAAPSITPLAKTGISVASQGINLKSKVSFAAFTDAATTSNDFFVFLNSNVILLLPAALAINLFQMGYAVSEDVQEGHFKNVPVKFTEIAVSWGAGIGTKMIATSVCTTLGIAIFGGTGAIVFPIVIGVSIIAAICAKKAMTKVMNKIYDKQLTAVKDVLVWIRVIEQSKILVHCIDYNNHQITTTELENVYDLVKIFDKSMIDRFRYICYTNEYSEEEAEMEYFKTTFDFAFTANPNSRKILAESMVNHSNLTIPYGRSIIIVSCYETRIVLIKAYEEEEDVGPFSLQKVYRTEVIRNIPKGRFVPNAVRLLLLSVETCVQIFVQRMVDTVECENLYRKFVSSVLQGITVPVVRNEKSYEKYGKKQVLIMFNARSDVTSLDSVDLNQ